MLNFWQTKILFDEKNDDKGAAPPVPPAPPVTPPNPEDKPIPSAKDLGYEEDPPAPPAPKPDDKTPPPKEEVKDPATGYTKEIPEEKEDPPATPAAPDPKDAEIEKHLGDGLSKEEVQKIKEFAKANELNEKQLKAYGDLRRAELKAIADLQANAEKEHEKQRNRVHREWQQELEKDPAFGGEKFKDNVMMVERLVQDFLPEYKKRLTEAGGMMPPYLMRDLVKLAQSVYKTETLVQGDPVAPPTDQNKDGKKNDPLAFYE